VVRTTRDTEENLTGVTNEHGEQYRIEHDLAGRVVKERGFDGRPLEFLHDRAGRCIETVDGKKMRTQIHRDAVGHVVQRIVPRKPSMRDPIPKGEAFEYGYDPAGRLVRAKNDACEVTFLWDALGRVVEEQADGVAVQSRYDRSGNRVGRTTSLGHGARYELDGNRELLAMTFGFDPRFGDFSPESLAAGGRVRAPWKAVWKRDAGGAEIERRLPGGVVSRWERDISERPRAHRVALDDAQILGTGYRWRSEEQLAALIDTHDGPTTFEHDARSYLVAATGPDGRVQHRAADAVGNLYRTRERKDRVYGPGGTLREADGVRYVHDEDGQLVEKVLPDGRRWLYGWDHTEQLRDVTRPDGAKVAFAYDALGRRVTKTFGGKTTRFVWDGNDLVHELADGAPLVTWEHEPGTFAPVAKVEGDKRYAVVCDHLGAPRMLLDEAGAVAWTARYDLYGVRQRAAQKTHCHLRWPGQYEDEETGLYYNRFRYYDPDSGRYISQDPIGLMGGLALYQYVPDPLASIDPWGLESCDKLTRQTRPLADEEILDHMFDRHAHEFLGRAAEKGRDLDRIKQILDRLRKSGLTFEYKLAATPVLGHLASLEGKYAVIFFFKEGPHAEKLASAFFPRQEQLSQIFKIMSRSGP
jgi:RHS repeat-associated protein